MPLGVQTYAPRPTSGGGGGAPQPPRDSNGQVVPQRVPGTPVPSNAPPLNPYGRGGNPYSGGWQTGRATTSDPWYQWQKSSDALAQAQYDQQVSSLLRQRDMLNQRGGSGGNRAAYNAAMQALESDRARLAADQALSASQRGFAATNLELSNRTQHGALMSDAVSRGADTATGVQQNYTDISDKNQLNYDQSIAQADRNDAYLSQLAKDYGVREEQIKAALTRGAAAYGMSYANAMAQIDEGLNSLDLDRRARALQAQYMILQAGGTITMPKAPTGAGSASTGTTTSSGGTMKYN